VELQRTTINAWQVFIGGIMLAPFAIALHENINTYDLRFWLSLAWLVIPVSIGAVQLWLRLLKGILFALPCGCSCARVWIGVCYFLLDEPFTMFTAIGAVLVIVALYIGQSRK